MSDLLAIFRTTNHLRINMKTRIDEIPESMPTSPPKFFEWIVRVRRKGQHGNDDTRKYTASHGKPVTAEHVRRSPSVKEFIGTDRLVSITPANDEAIHGGKGSPNSKKNVARRWMSRLVIRFVDG
jgi:hypothetical protein